MIRFGCPDLFLIRTHRERSIYHCFDGWNIHITLSVLSEYRSMTSTVFSPIQFCHKNTIRTQALSRRAPAILAGAILGAEERPNWIHWAGLNTVEIMSQDSESFESVSHTFKRMLNLTFSKSTYKKWAWTSKTEPWKQSSVIQKKVLFFSRFYVLVTE